MEASATIEAGGAVDRSRRNQLWAFLVTGFFLAVSVGAYAVNELYLYLAAYIWFGFVYGMALQSGRFCFSSAFRDLFAVGVPRMVVGIMIATVVFGATAAAVSAAGMSTFHAAPFGVHSVVAGLIFGVGMVLAGGCASSSFYKAGEGNLTAAMVVVTMGVTQALFVDAGGFLGRLVPASWREAALAQGLPASVMAKPGWFDQYTVGYLWQRPTARIAEWMHLGSDSFAGAFVANFLVGVLLPALVVLAVVYAFWARKGFMKKRKREGKPGGAGAELAGFWTMVTSSRGTAITGVVLGVAAGLQMFVTKGLRLRFGIENAAGILAATGHDAGVSLRGTVHDPGHWSVATHSAQWAAWMFQKLGWDMSHNVYFGWSEGIPNPVFNLAAWMSIALVGGAAVMALLNDEFSWKKPTLELSVFAVVGGALMGVGARLGLGCNIGAFFARAANGDASGWLFAVGMTGGAWIAVKFFNWWTERKMAKEVGLATDLQL
ncbi:MAG TPA: YeeE/YedE family protein [Anaeromyxobacter sp.]